MEAILFEDRWLVAPAAAMSSSALATVIPPWEARTLPGLFRERVRRTPGAVAYLTHDPREKKWVGTTWEEMARHVALWRTGFVREGLLFGERVAVMLANRRKWVLFDQAAMAIGLVVVPLYMDDRPENTAHILADSGASLLLVQNLEDWKRLEPVKEKFSSLRRVVYLSHCQEQPGDPRVRHVCEWLPSQAEPDRFQEGEPDDLATIVYTSGTTGPPKGVMLSHRNILLDAYFSLSRVAAGEGDLFLSFLPLSHALERTAGYYLSMMAGATVAFARSIPQLVEDMGTLKPTVLISVPRIYERLHERIQERLRHAPVWRRLLFALTVAVGWRRFLKSQGRAGWHPFLLMWPILDLMVARKVRNQLGGRLRVAVSGGARLGETVGRMVIGLGIPLLQGYGLTETSPVIAVNTLEDNHPTSVGSPLPGVQVKISEQGELLVRGPEVMMGYWNNPQATSKVIDVEGWFHTGDMARLEGGHLLITGRFKEIIVLANGRKVAPGDLEEAIRADPFFAQVMVVGEGRPFLSLLVAPESEAWAMQARQLKEDPTNLDSPVMQQWILERVGQLLVNFPGFARIRGVVVCREGWRVDNGLLTPTMKPKREKILARETERLEAMYQARQGVG